MFQDIRFGVRTILKNKGITAIAVLCLAIGIGLNTMMFSVVDGVLIQSLPYRDAGRLVQFHTTNQHSGIRFGALSWLDLKEWRERATSFEAIAGVPGGSSSNWFDQFHLLVCGRWMCRCLPCGGDLRIDCGVAASQIVNDFGRPDQGKEKRGRGSKEKRHASRRSVYSRTRA